MESRRLGPYDDGTQEPLDKLERLEQRSEYFISVTTSQT